MNKFHKIVLIFLAVALAIGVAAIIFTMLHGYDLFGSKHGLSDNEVQEEVRVRVNLCDEIQTIDTNLTTQKTCAVAKNVRDFFVKHQEAITEQLDGCAFKGLCKDVAVKDWYLTPCFTNILATLDTILAGGCNNPDDPQWADVRQAWLNFYDGVMPPCCEHPDYNWEIVIATTLPPPLQGKTFCTYVNKPVSASVYSTLDACTAALP